jgi:hypothetical protein
LVVAMTLTPAEVVALRLPDLYAQARAGRLNPELFWPRRAPLTNAIKREVAMLLAREGYEVVTWSEDRDKVHATLRRVNNERLAGST